MNNSTWVGWHFLPADGMLRYHDYRSPRVGQTLTMMEGNIPKPCHNGMHASKRAIDALTYAPGPIACRVVLSGHIVEAFDKAAATERTISAMADASDLLHKFACYCAETVLHLAGDEVEACTRVLALKRQWAHMRDDAVKLDDEKHRLRVRAKALERKINASLYVIDSPVLSKETIDTMIHKRDAMRVVALAAETYNAAHLAATVSDEAAVLLGLVEMNRYEGGAEFEKRVDETRSARSVQNDVLTTMLYNLLSQEGEMV